MRTYWDGKKQGIYESICVINRLMRKLENDITFFMTSGGDQHKLDHANAMQKASRILRDNLQKKMDKIL